MYRESRVLRCSPNLILHPSSFNDVAAALWMTNINASSALDIFPVSCAAFCITGLRVGACTTLVRGAHILDEGMSKVVNVSGGWMCVRGVGYRCCAYRETNVEFGCAVVVVARIRERVLQSFLGIVNLSAWSAQINTRIVVDSCGGPG